MRQAEFKFCARRSRQQRVSQRRNVLLWDAASTKRTQERYVEGLRQLKPHLKKIKSSKDLDEAVSEWIQLSWEKGDSLHIVNDGLCGLQRYYPWVKHKIPLSWRLFSVWRKVEAPNRAPPLTKEIVDSFVMYAIAHRDLSFAAMMVLGFYGLLRTGELMQIRPSDILVGRRAAVISLKDTKSGLRNAAHETVSITEDLALEVLRAAISESASNNFQKVPLWSKSPQCFRNAFRRHCSMFHLQAHNFRPYSLRRGGATAIFQQSGSMELALLKGRWTSTKVAKIYLADGLSYLPGLTYSVDARKQLSKWSVNNQLKTDRDRGRGE